MGLKNITKAFAVPGVPTESKIMDFQNECTCDNHQSVKFHSVHDKLINHANSHGHSSEQCGFGVDLMAFEYDPYIRPFNLQGVS
jgi:hypothetical protein